MPKFYAEDPLEGPAEAAPEGPLQLLVNGAQPGDHVQIPAGIYSERIKISNSGTAENPIVFEGSGNVIISGEGLMFPDEKGEAAPLWHFEDVRHIMLKNVILRDWRSNKKSQLPMGVLISGKSSDIQLHGLEVCNIEQTYAGQETKPKADRLGSDAHAIAVYGELTQPITNIKIQHCHVHDCKLGSSEAIVINGNVEDWLIENNRVENCNNIGIDIIGHEGTCPDPKLDQARKGVVRGNQVRNISSQGNWAYGQGDPSKPSSEYDLSAGGIYVDGGQDVLIENNIIEFCDIGIEIASEHKGKLTSNIQCRNNHMLGNRQCGLSVGGYDDQRGKAERIAIQGNHFEKNGSLGWGLGEIAFKYHLGNIQVQDNYFLATSWPPEDDRAVMVAFHSKKPIKDLVIEGNHYFVEPHQGIPVWGQPSGKKMLESFWAWQTLGFDRSGFFGDWSHKD